MADNNLFNAYRTAKNTLVITGYKGTATSLIIPTSLTVDVGGYINSENVYIPNLVTLPVEVFNALGNGAVTSVTIPSGISVSYGAFAGSGVRSVTLPDNITSISAGMFSGAANLEIIIIPNNVTYIGYHAFANSGLIEITIANNTL